MLAISQGLLISINETGKNRVSPLQNYMIYFVMQFCSGKTILSVQSEEQANSVQEILSSSTNLHTVHLNTASTVLHGMDCCQTLRYKMHFSIDIQT